jgi:hypothetical protein
MGKLVVDGNSVYEVDETCMKEKERIKHDKKNRETKSKQQNCHRR